MSYFAYDRYGATMREPSAERMAALLDSLRSHGESRHSSGRGRLVRK